MQKHEKWRSIISASKQSHCQIAEQTIYCPQTVLCVVLHTTLLGTAWILFSCSNALPSLWIWRCLVVYWQWACVFCFYACCMCYFLSLLFGFKLGMPLTNYFHYRLISWLFSRLIVWFIKCLQKSYLAYFFCCPNFLKSIWLLQNNRFGLAV